MPNWSGGADPQASSVIQSGVAASPWPFITERNFWMSCCISPIVGA